MEPYAGNHRHANSMGLCSCSQFLSLERVPINLSPWATPVSPCAFPIPILQEDVMEIAAAVREKRRHMRFMALLPFDLRVEGEPRLVSGLTMNLSEKGLLICTAKDLQIGRKLIADVLFTRGYELALYTAEAEIIWKQVHYMENWRGYKYGLQFSQVLKKDHLKCILGSGPAPDLIAIEK
jgi:hypothetical protein